MSTIQLYQFDTFLQAKNGEIVQKPHIKILNDKTLKSILCTGIVSEVAPLQLMALYRFIKIRSQRRDLHV